MHKVLLRQMPSISPDGADSMHEIQKVIFQCTKSTLYKEITSGCREMNRDTERQTKTDIETETEKGRGIERKSGCKGERESKV